MSTNELFLDFVTFALQIRITIRQRHLVNVKQSKLLDRKYPTTSKNMIVEFEINQKVELQCEFLSVWLKKGEIKCVDRRDSGATDANHLGHMGLS